MARRRQSERVPVKTCVACGREMTWRRKWARDWERVKYCSSACRGRGVRDVDGRLEAAILGLLRERAGGTICPSEAARHVAAAGRASDAPADRRIAATEEQTWRALMEPARRAARRLAARGVVLITQGGRVVDPGTARGPIRIRAANAGRI